MEFDAGETARDTAGRIQWLAWGLVAAALLFAGCLFAWSERLLASPQWCDLVTAGLGWGATIMVVLAARRMPGIDQAVWLVLAGALGFQASGISIGLMESLTPYPIAPTLQMTGAGIAGVLSVLVISTNAFAPEPGHLQALRHSLDLMAILAAASLACAVLTPLVAPINDTLAFRPVSAQMLDLVLIAAILPRLLITSLRAERALQGLVWLLVGLTLVRLFDRAMPVHTALPASIEALRCSLYAPTALVWLARRAPDAPWRARPSDDAASPLPGIAVWLALAMLLIATSVPTLLLLGLLIVTAMRALLQAHLRQWQVRQWRRRIRGAQQAHAAAQAQLHTLARLIHDQAPPLSGLDCIQRDLEVAEVYGWARRIGDHLGLLLTLSGQLRAAVSDRRAAQPRALVKVAAVPIIEAAIDAAQLRAELAQVALCSALNNSHAHAIVLGDAASLRRILDNLVSNALDATAAGGQVIVELWDDWQYPEWLTITVHDSGPRARDAAQGGSIELSQLRARGPGMGLGLRIVGELIEAQDGAYGMEEKDGGGRDVWIRLRRCEPDRPTAPLSLGTDA